MLPNKNNIIKLDIATKVDQKDQLEGFKVKHMPIIITIKRLQHYMRIKIKI